MLSDNIPDNRRLLVAEFIYRERPTKPQARTVFDYALTQRLAALRTEDAVLYLVNSQATFDSLHPVLNRFPHLAHIPILCDPNPLDEPATRDTPRLLDWPGAWQPMQTSDRWARIMEALRIASTLNGSGWLVMPAHDAVYSPDLLSRLIRHSETQMRNGIPAAVSPLTARIHGAVPGMDIPQATIDLLNATFNRDPTFAWKVRFGRVQAFWAKMGMLPFSVCGDLRGAVDTSIWEDDLEIDSALHRLGYPARALWVADPVQYRQVLPVFDMDDARRVIDRTLHYSLPISSRMHSASAIAAQASRLTRLRERIDPAFKHANTTAERLITSCWQAIQVRLDQYGASWVDWGAYRYVVRIREPGVEVWWRVR